MSSNVDAGIKLLSFERKSCLYVVRFRPISWLDIFFWYWVGFICQALIVLPNLLRLGRIIYLISAGCPHFIFSKSRFYRQICHENFREQFFNMLNGKDRTKNHGLYFKMRYTIRTHSMNAKQKVHLKKKNCISCYQILHWAVQMVKIIISK